MLSLLLFLCTIGASLSWLFVSDTFQGIQALSYNDGSSSSLKAIIKLNDVLPRRQAMNFTACFDFQTSVSVDVCEWVFPEHRRWIGSIVLNDFALGGNEVFTVTFENKFILYSNCTGPDPCGFDCEIWRLAVTVAGAGQQASAEFDLTYGRAFINRHQEREEWLRREWDRLFQVSPDISRETFAGDEEACLPPAPILLLPSP